VAGVGLAAAAPVPKLHHRLEIVPLEASVKLTVSGAVPVRGDPLNPAVGLTQPPALTVT
jgi:hypothetical protein